MKRRVRVQGLPDWMPDRLLGPGHWARVDGAREALLDTEAAALLLSRLRGHGYGGQPVQITVRPSLKRRQVREGRTADARLRRQRTPGFTHPQARLDDEGRFSLTPESLALALARRRAPGLVLDAGCGAGGNTIAFARVGHRVRAVERNPQRLELARHNARLHGVVDRIEFICGDLMQHLADPTVDWVWLDPPWGVDWDRRRCDLASFPALAGWLEAVAAPEVWLKLPPSFDAAVLPALTPEPVFGEGPGDHHRVKFLWLHGPPPQGKHEPEQQ